MSDIIRDQIYSIISEYREIYPQNFWFLYMNRIIECMYTLLVLRVVELAANEKFIRKIRPSTQTSINYPFMEYRSYTRGYIPFAMDFILHRRSNKRIRLPINPKSFPDRSIKKIIIRLLRWDIVTWNEKDDSSILFDFLKKQREKKKKKKYE